MSDTPALREALKDRYDVERELGRGGMATVYLARDRKHDRAVAIKVLHPGLAASLGAERFLREIRIAARLAHPHILPLIDSGEAGGLLYCVTPHVPDGTLRERMDREGPLALGDALRILEEVGGALDFAHRQGFVHRDVKPDNILFADGHAVLADFGIACVLGTGDQGSGVGDQGTITESGTVLGTPEYMSPEQASGDQIDARSDLYSLACVAYEMLAGRPPLRGIGARATMARQVSETPAPIRVHRPEIGASVEQALARALAKNPAERFATAFELVHALATTDSGGHHAVRAARVIAVLPFVNASPDPDNEYLSDGITDELIDALAKVSGLKVASRTSVFSYKGRSVDVRSIGAMLGATWVLEGTVRRAGPKLRVTAQLTNADDGQLLWSQRFDRTFEDIFAIQEEIARTIVDTLWSGALIAVALPPARRRTSSVVAYGLYLKGRFAWNQRTQESVNEAIRFFEQAIAEDPSYAQAYAGLADSFALSLDYRSMPVAEMFALAEKYARKALELDETVAEAHASLAWSLFIYDWDWAEAKREFERAIELDPSYATARQWHSFWLAGQGRHDEAIAEIHRANELDPQSVPIQRSVGWVYYYARRYEQARLNLERAVFMNPTADETYRVLGLVHAMREKWDEAERTMREAVTLSNRATYDLAGLGYVLARAGRRDEAVTLLKEIEARAANGYVSPMSFATICIGLGDDERALDYIEAALAERRGWLAYLKVHPIADPLRKHPRFSRLLQTMKL